MARASGTLGLRTATPAPALPAPAPSPPDAHGVLPWWIACLAGPPPIPVSTRTGHGSGGGHARLQGIIGRLLAARRGERNRQLFWASLRIGELVAEGTSIRPRPGRH